MKYLDKYPNCVGCPVKKWCGTMISCVRLCKSYQGNKEETKMNYEERYKQALERAKELYNNLIKEGTLATSKGIESIFPELRESEDERIMKDLKFYLEVRRCQTNDDEKYISCNKFLSWLEKQGEKPTSWSENDEKMINLLIKIFEVNHPNEHFKVNPIGTTSMEAISTKEIVDWLKSLKPNHWKPSKEQMQALKKRTRGLHTSSETRKALESLIDDLTRLKLC